MPVLDTCCFQVCHTLLHFDYELIQIIELFVKGRVRPLKGLHECYVDMHTVDDGDVRDPQ